MTLLSLVLASLLASSPAAAPASAIEGAWQTTRQSDGATGTLIIADGHFAIAWYQKDPAKFVSTEGGAIERVAEGVEATYEFHTAQPDLVGQSHTIGLSVTPDELKVGDHFSWKRIDDGTPGALEGAWLMTGRKNDKGEITKRKPGVRRTMKILSGTRFQWIAFNVETREFFGTGGGTYTTKDGAYTESIEFFSRDDTKAGMSLPFTWAVTEGDWHHEGKSTAGNPMHEVWEKREKLGI